MTTPDRAGAVLSIDLDAIAANYRLLAERAGRAETCPVVKADAYGLGVGPVARALWAAGAGTFYVALPDEGIALRAVLPEAGIRVLSGVMPGTERDLFEHGLVPVLNGLDDIERWSRFCRRIERRLTADLHVDTGMNRLGLSKVEALALALDPAPLDNMDLHFLMSHLACADERGHPMNAEQLARFVDFHHLLPCPRRSFANSAGLFLGPEYRFEGVRPGCALYGVNPAPDGPNPMAQPVRLQGKILQVRDVDTTMTVGYGATHKVARRGRTATVAVGYADGFLRSLSNRGSAYVDDVRAPIVGRVSMDLIAIDVTEVPERLVRPGLFVDLIGAHNPVDVVAADAGTIGYEILTGLGARYHRHYVGGAAAS